MEIGKMNYFVCAILKLFNYIKITINVNTLGHNCQDNLKHL
ncbi:hypothetical protein KsCSTR_46760 [Candidatus Kuenenia stuttgartiensis]|uniref:Uncharacterized protein n=1 Tax=Kuenenia stuttgartiensis TaxID=174633 RepID=A0A6G7GXG9_KUEST|nr:hypothetical protein KsCSTR_46760 [Candidatus Kuenenia stuttgartiensis]